MGRLFIGNAAILEPINISEKGMKMAKETKILAHSTEEGFIEVEIDVDYIRKIKKDYPMNEL